MFDSEFDELFRSRLKDHPSAVPKDMWQRIRGKEGGHRGFSAWRGYFIGAMVLLAGATIGPRIWRKAFTRVVPVTQPAAAQTHSVSDPASIRSGSVPRSQSEPAFIATTANRRVAPSRHGESRRRAAPRRPTPRRPASGRVSASVRLFEPGRSPDPHGQSTYPHDQSPDPSPVFVTRTRTAHDRPLALEPISSGPFPSPYAYRPKGKGIPCPNPENLQENSGWFAEAYFSPDILFTSRHGGFSWSAGARLGKTFNDRFSAMVGLQLSHVSLQGVADSLLRAQQFNNIEVPVLFGYQLGSADLNTTIHAGVIWNIHSQPVGPDYGIPYRSNTGFAFYFGLDFLRRLDSRWSVFAEPHFRYQLSNRAANLLQSPDLGGLSLGIRYNFTRRAGMR